MAAGNPAHPRRDRDPLLHGRRRHEALVRPGGQRIRLPLDRSARHRRVGLRLGSGDGAFLGAQPQKPFGAEDPLPDQRDPLLPKGKPDSISPRKRARHRLQVGG